MASGEIIRLIISAAAGYALGNISPGDVIAVKESKQGKKLFEAVKEVGAKSALPQWLEFDKTTLTGKVLQMPKREDIDLRIKEHMIVELYSK